MSSGLGWFFSERISDAEYEQCLTKLASVAQSDDAKEALRKVKVYVKNLKKYGKE